LVDQGTSALLISGFDDRGTGGLFSFDGSELETIDRLSTTGLATRGSTVGRMLRASADHDSVAELLIYDERGVVEYRRLDSIVDPHDLTGFDDGSWLVVSSVNNSLTQIGADGALRTIWAPSAIPDSWHMNCVTVAGGELWVTAFGRFPKTRGWADEAAHGAGFLMNLSTGQEFGGLTHPHSPRLIAEEWWACNSLEGTLVQWDQASASWITRVQLRGYPRGLATQGDMKFVGESQTRGVPNERARLAIIQGDEVVDRIPLPCAEIYDVVMAPASAIEALKRGFNTNPQRVAAREPDGFLTMVGEDELAGGMEAVLEPQSVTTRIRCDAPPTMGPGESCSVQVVVEYAGDPALVSGPPYPVYLSYRWIDANGSQIDGERTPLGRQLFRGDAVVYEMQIEAPRRSGSYTLSVSLLQEGIFWFEDTTPSNGFRQQVVVSEGESRSWLKRSVGRTAR
jgi:hypothetical protein